MGRMASWFPPETFFGSLTRGIRLFRSDPHSFSRVIGSPDFSGGRPASEARPTEGPRTFGAKDSEADRG
jgi:hypothetical protein